MGSVNSAEDPYGYGYGYGAYGYGNGYNNELERYYRRYYPQYNAYYSPAQYTTPTTYYNAYQQQLYPSTMMNGYATASPAYTTMAGYGGYGAPTYQSVYNTPLGYSSIYNGGVPTYGAYNNTYYPNYMSRTYM